MSDFTESLHKYRGAEQPIEALFDDIERIVKDDEKSPILLLAELTHEHNKHPLVPRDVKSIKNRIVNLAKSQNEGEVDRIELDDTVETSHTDDTEELDHTEHFDDTSDIGGEHIIESAKTQHIPVGVARTQVNGHANEAEAVLNRPSGIARGELLGRVLNDRYVLRTYLGAGGMATVYEALDRHRNPTDVGTPYVAIKIFARSAVPPRQDLLQNLRREVKRFQQFSHPNIVEIYEVNVDDDIAYLVMEYLSGKTLRDMIRVPGFEGLPLPEAFPIIRSMGEALAFAHDHGVVHYDFKPKNVMLTSNGQIKVIDFGIARAYRETEHGDVSSPNTTALTPAYASAEMLEEQSPDPRDDVYAFGCTVYELLTGRHPFDRKGATEARDNGMQAQCPAELAPDAWEALRKTLAFERHDRTLDIRDVLESLNHYEHENTTNTSLLKVAIAASMIGVMAMSSYFLVTDKEIGAQDVAGKTNRAPIHERSGDSNTEASVSEPSGQGRDSADFAKIREQNSRKETPEAR